MPKPPAFGYSLETISRSKKVPGRKAPKIVTLPHLHIHIPEGASPENAGKVFKILAGLTNSEEYQASSPVKTSRLGETVPRKFTVEHWETATEQHRGALLKALKTQLKKDGIKLAERK